MMTEEQNLSDDKMRDEIANLIAHSSKLNAETAKIAGESFMVRVMIITGFVVAAATLLSRFI